MSETVFVYQSSSHSVSYFGSKRLAGTCNGLVLYFSIMSWLHFPGDDIILNDRLSVRARRIQFGPPKGVHRY